MITDSLEEEGVSTVLYFIWPVFGLVCSLLTRQLLLIHKVFPFTALLLILGMALGLFSGYFEFGLLGESTRVWADINPELILYIFLPALVFSDGLSTKTHYFRRQLGSIVLLAGPGVVLGAFLTAAFVKYVLPITQSWAHGLILGSIVSATDPVAILSLLKDVGADKKLATIISGESLINDGTSVVLFKLFLDIAAGKSVSAVGVINFLFLEVAAGPAIGMAFAVVVLFWLARSRDAMIEVVLILTSSYTMFITASGLAYSSGVLAIVTGSLILADLGRLSVTGEGAQITKYTWEVLEYVANSLVFYLAGTIIGIRIATAAGSSDITGKELGWAILLYFALLVIRGIIIAIAYPLMRRSIYSFSWKDATVLWWGGLRGAVGLSLALSLDEFGERGIIDEDVTDRFLLYVSVVTVMTLVINGPTTGALMKAIKIIDQKTKEDLNTLAKEHIHEETARYFDEIERDDLLGIKASRSVVGKYARYMRRAEYSGEAGRQDQLPRSAAIKRYSWHKWHQEKTRKLERLQKSESFAEMKSHKKRVIIDAASRYLGSVYMKYWVLRDRSLISQSACLILLNSVDQAMDDIFLRKNVEDLKFENLLTDWTYLHKEMVDFANRRITCEGVFCKFWSSVSNFLTGYDWYVYRTWTTLELAYAYLDAHQCAKKDFLGLLSLEGDGETHAIMGTIFNDLALISDQHQARAQEFIKSARPFALQSFINKRVILQLTLHQSHLVERMMNEHYLSEKDGQIILTDLEVLGMEIQKKGRDIQDDTAAALSEENELNHL